MTLGIVLFLLIQVLNSSSVFGMGSQTVTVSGLIECALDQHPDDSPLGIEIEFPPMNVVSLKGAKIEIKDKNVLFDDSLSSASAVSDTFGRFSLSGNKFGLFALKPYITIVHSCHSHLVPELPSGCFYYSTITLPHDGKAQAEYSLRIILGADGIPTEIVCE